MVKRLNVLQFRCFCDTYVSWLRESSFYDDDDLTIKDGNTYRPTEMNSVLVARFPFSVQHPKRR